MVYLEIWVFQVWRKGNPEPRRELCKRVIFNPHKPTCSQLQTQTPGPRTPNSRLFSTSTWKPDLLTPQKILKSEPPIPGSVFPCHGSPRVCMRSDQPGSLSRGLMSETPTHPMQASYISAHTFNRNNDTSCQIPPDRAGSTGYAALGTWSASLGVERHGRKNSLRTSPSIPNSSGQSAT